MRGVPILTFPEWATRTAKRLVPALKKRKSTDDTPIGARRLKRHRTLLKLLENAVRQEARAYDDVFMQIGGKRLLDAWVRRRNVPPVQRLNALVRWLKNDAKDLWQSGGLQLRRAIDAAREELGDPVETWAIHSQIETN